MDIEDLEKEKSRKKDPETGSKVKGFHWEDDMEKEIDHILDEGEKINYNFLINASNQANITNVQRGTLTQHNLLFLMVSPYYIDQFNMEDLDISLRMEGDGKIFVNGTEFHAFEIKPGIKVFGITAHT